MVIDIGQCCIGGRGVEGGGKSGWMDVMLLSNDFMLLSGVGLY